MFFKGHHYSQYTWVKLDKNNNYYGNLFALFVLQPHAVSNIRTQTKYLNLISLFCFLLMPLPLIYKFTKSWNADGLISLFAIPCTPLSSHSTYKGMIISFIKSILKSWWSLQSDWLSAVRFIPKSHHFLL